MPERTLILIKPDGVQRGLVGRIIERYEQRGLRICGLKLVQVDRAQAERQVPGIDRHAPPVLLQQPRAGQADGTIVTSWQAPDTYQIVGADDGTIYLVPALFSRRNELLRIAP